MQKLPAIFYTEKRNDTSASTAQSDVESGASDRDCSQLKGCVYTASYSSQECQSQMAKKSYNRSVEDIGNILAMEHINLRVPDQGIATTFYVSGLGLTRDPFVDFGQFNIWINAGSQQFHLPTGEAQVLRGEVHLTVKDLDHLEARLKKLKNRLKGTQFSFVRNEDNLLTTCPWGNKIRCLRESPAKSLGIYNIELPIEKRKLEGVARFYEKIFQAPTKLSSRKLEVTVGAKQTLTFTALKKAESESVYDGHHIAIYTPNFSSPYQQLKSHKQTIEESDQHQYRFYDLFDPTSGEKLYTLEHEVRSLHHPMFNRTLTNRNAEQSFFDYTRGQDSYYPSGS